MHFTRHHHLEKHHLFMIIFVSVALLVAGNALAIRGVYNNLTYSPPPAPAPAIFARYDEEPQPQTEEDTKSSLAPLADSLIDQLADLDAPVSVGVKSLTTDEYVGLNDTTTMNAASFYKLFVAYEVARQVDEGDLTWEQPTGFDAGSTSVVDCFRVMINVSDNDCGRALRKLVNADDTPLPTLAEAGFTGTNIMNDYPTTSVTDVVLLFEKVHSGDDFSQETADEFRDALLSQKINNRLPQGLPVDLDIAHKTADLEGFSHDGGIVYLEGNPYVLVVMSGQWDNEYTQAPPAISAISQTVYDWFSSANS